MRSAHYEPRVSPAATAVAEASSPPLRPRVAFYGRQATDNLEHHLRSDSSDCPGLGLEVAKLEAECSPDGDVEPHDEEESGVAIHELRAGKLGDRKVVASLVDKEAPQLPEHVKHDKRVEKALEVLGMGARVSDPFLAMLRKPRARYTYAVRLRDVLTEDIADADDEHQPERLPWDR